jgi:hypothetical protein
MKPNSSVEVKSFEIKDCTLIALATGIRAQNLRELKEQLSYIQPDSIYYHFWGSLLRPRFDDPEYHNDFALWAAHQLHDPILAERLAVIDPSEYSSIRELREELLEIMEARLDEVEFPLYSRRDNQFEFIRSQIVIFNTKMQLKKPSEFRKILPGFSAGSIFYHFIDARRRTDTNVDDLQNWLSNFGDKYNDLCQSISEIDPYFSSLTKLREQLVNVFQSYFEEGKQ